MIRAMPLISSIAAVRLQWCQEAKLIEREGVSVASLKRDCSSRPLA